MQYSWLLGVLVLSTARLAAAQTRLTGTVEPLEPATCDKTINFLKCGDGCCTNTCCGGGCCPSNAQCIKMGEDDDGTCCPVSDRSMCGLRSKKPSGSKPGNAPAPTCKSFVDAGANSCIDHGSGSKWFCPPSHPCNLGSGGCVGGTELAFTKCMPGQVPGSAVTRAAKSSSPVETAAATKTADDNEPAKTNAAAATTTGAKGSGGVGRSEQGLHWIAGAAVAIVVAIAV